MCDGIVRGDPGMSILWIVLHRLRVPHQNPRRLQDVGGAEEGAGEEEGGHGGAGGRTQAG